MKWAQLTTQFFTDHPPTREFFELHLGAFPWNEEVLPVYAWENQVYIAAVNPSAITEMMSAWPANWVLVQATPESLQSLWQSWNQNEAEVSESNPFDSEPRSMNFEDATQPRIAVEMSEDTSPPVEMPRLPSDEWNEPPARTPMMEATPPPAIPLPEAKSPTRPASKTATKPAPPPAQKSDFNPEDPFSGMDEVPAASVAMTEDALDLSVGFPDDGDEAPTSNEDEGLTPSVKEEDLDGAPEGFEGVDVAVSAAPGIEMNDEFSGIESMQTGSAQVSLSSLQKGPVSPDGSVSKIPTSLPKAKAPVENKPQIPVSSGMSKMDPPPAAADRGRVSTTAAAAHPAANPAASPAATPVATASAVTPPAKAPPGKTAPGKTAPSEKTQAPVEAILPATDDQEPTTTFHGLKVSAETKKSLAGLPEMFSGALLTSKAGNSLRVLASSKPGMAAEGAERDFSLATPSPFRIVLRTEKSYHGYLIQSPFLDGFFAAWNGGKYPEHLTVAPILSGNNILGFVVAFGSTAAAGKAGLHAVEKLAQDLVHNWPAMPAQNPNPKSKAG